MLLGLCLTSASHSQIHSSFPQKSSESLDYEALECLTLTHSTSTEESLPKEQPCPPGPPTGKSTLQAEANTILRPLWFRRTKNCQEQQSLDKGRKKQMSTKEGDNQRAFPRLHSSIHTAMEEIQKVSKGVIAPAHTATVGCVKLT